MKLTSIILATLLAFSLNSNALAMPPLQSSVEASTNEFVNSESNALFYSNRASIKFLKKDTLGAIADFDKAITLEPQNPNLYLNRGYIKQVINDLNGAMNDYNAALKLNSKFAFAYNNRGVLKAAMGDINGALSDYEIALSINPKYADVYYNRGNLKYMTNDNQGALSDYDKAIEYNPKDSEAYNNRGVVKKRLNFNVGALSDYSQAIAINPKDSIAYANRGRLKKLYFDNEGAAIDLDQAIALAETQVFIKNVKPLLAKNTNIVAIPVVDGITENLTIANNTNNAKNYIVNDDIENVAKNVNNASINTTQKEQITILNSNPVLESNKISESKSSIKENETKKVDAIHKTVTQNDVAQTTIAAGIGTVKVATNPEISTTAIRKNPTTNVKLAESYYIRGLQKCVLRDLQGAIADLNKAIENNTKFADAYFYRGAIKRELGDNEGFKKDYSTAIQINPSLQQFNDLNSLTVIPG